MTTTDSWSMPFNGTTIASNTTTMATEQDITGKVLSFLLTMTVGIVMIGMGCGVDLQKVKKHLKRPTGIIVGLICQFVLMPAVAYVLATIANMDELLTLAILLVGSCPGGTTSNVVSYWLDGDMDLSVTMTTVSSTLGLGIMPFLLWIYSFGFSSLTVPYARIGIILAALIIPIAIGVLIRIKFPQFAPKLLKILSVVGVIAILAVAVLSIVTYNGKFKLVPGQIVCAFVFPGIGMFFGYGFSSLVSIYKPLFLHHYQRRTISIETGVQNAQLAAAIINVSGFSDAEKGQIILFPLIYLVSQLIWIALMLIAYRIYICKHPPEVEVEDVENNFNGEKEKGIPSVDGSINNAFSYPELPKYKDVVGNDISQSTSL